VPFVGTVEPAREVRLEALAPGRVEAIAIEDGGTAVAGQVLFRIGGERFEQAVAAAEADASSARDTLAARADQLERARRRAADHLAGPGEVADARAAFDAAESRQAGARARVRVLTAAREVRAPFAGSMLRREVSVGQEVSVGDLLARLADPSSARVAATVVAGPNHAVHPGQEARVEEGGGSALEARVAGVAQLASASGGQRVWLVGDAISHLDLGTAVGGWIVVDRHEGVVVPASAVVRDDDDRPYVFVGRAAPFERRPVHVGVAVGDRLELTTGVAAGETVVSEGAYELLWASFSTSFTAPD